MNSGAKQYVQDSLQAIINYKSSVQPFKASCKFGPCPRWANRNGNVIPRPLPCPRINVHGCDLITLIGDLQFAAIRCMHELRYLAGKVSTELPDPHMQLHPLELAAEWREWVQINWLSSRPVPHMYPDEKRMPRPQEPHLSSEGKPGGINWRKLPLVHPPTKRFALNGQPLSFSSPSVPSPPPPPPPAPLCGFCSPPKLICACCYNSVDNSLSRHGIA